MCFLLLRGFNVAVTNSLQPTGLIATFFSPSDIVFIFQDQAFNLTMEVTNPKIINFAGGL